MSAASGDGRHGESDLTVEQERKERLRLIDVAFFAFLAAFIAVTLFGITLAFGSLLASRNPDLKQGFYSTFLASSGLVARQYLRMFKASSELPSPLLSWLSMGFSVLNLGLAVFLMWLRPRDRTARLLAIGMVGTAAVFNLPVQATIRIIAMTPAEQALHASFNILTGLTYAAALLMFPDGRFVPRWRRGALVALYVPLATTSAVISLRTEGYLTSVIFPSQDVGGGITVAGIADRPGLLLLFFGVITPIVGVLAQAYRFRRSDDPAEHQQARLLFWALLPTFGIGAWFFVTRGLGALGEGGRFAETPVDVFRFFLPVFLLVPLVLFLGLIRYRLWDIDRVVNRTLVYGLATGILLSAYFGIVVLLQRALSVFTARNDIAVAVSTLVVAVAFFPLQRRIQDFVDRRFYRHRYDAQRTMEAFSSRLRDQLDLEALGFELRGVVARTMQPSEITLLVRNDAGQLEWRWTYRGRAK